MSAAWRPAHQMSDAEVLAESHALTVAEDRSALASPVRLARHLDPTYVRRRHTNLVGQAMARLAGGEYNRLLITLPPQCGKTWTAVIWGGFWWLANHPAHRVIIGSYGNMLAVNRGKTIRKLVSLHGGRFGLELEHGSTQKAEWWLTSGGGLKSVGRGAGITGHPGDLALIDDPHSSRADADSLPSRDSVADWYSADITSRMAPFAPVVLVMTRWHPDDLAGRLLQQEGRVEDGGRWMVLHMPALADPGRLGPDPLDRQAGEPLPHPSVPAGDIGKLRSHWEDKRATSLVRDWNALYQGDPQPAAGALLTEAQIRAQRWFGNPDRQVTATPRKHAVAVDPSGGGRDTCGIVAGWLGDDDRLYLTHDLTDVLGPEVWGRRVCELAAEIGADRIIIEANYGGAMATMIVKTAWKQLRDEELKRLGGDHRGGTYKREARYNRPAPRVEPVHSRKSKLLRAEPVAQYWTADRIRTTTYLPDLEAEWATWQPGPDSPGRIDASVHLAWAIVPEDTTTSDVSSAHAMTGVDLTRQLHPGHHF